MNKEEFIFGLIDKLISNDQKPSETTHKSIEPVDKGRYIVIGNRANVVVGDLTIIGSTGYMKNASVIRRWGTDKGLGQLAIEGAQPNTKLDPCGEFEFEVLTTCGMIPVKSNF